MKELREATEEAFLKMVTEITLMLAKTIGIEADSLSACLIELSEKFKLENSSNIATELDTKLAREISPNEASNVLI